MSATIQPTQTGSQTVASGGASINPISYGYYPAEGSRAVSVIYNWAAQTGYAEDLSQLVARGVETTIQSIFIDNTNCTTTVFIQISGTGQVISCPAGGQGIFPALFGGSPNFQIFVGSTGVGSTRCNLLNVPTGSGVWASGSATPRTLVPLDVSTVATGGTAVVALSAGHRAAGGWIQNPLTASTNLGINEIGTASGTTSVGNTTFIAPGDTYYISPNGGAVSVISSDSNHNFSGYGFQ